MEKVKRNNIAVYKIEKMATDVEESDTDYRERPVSPKRQCTRLVNVNETLWDTEKSSCDKEEVVEDIKDIECDDAERLANEKLKKWQTYQAAKGCVDNAINIFRETCIKRANLLRRLEKYQLQLFRGNDMENTAVMMAIRNHGLIQSDKLISQSSALYRIKTPECLTNNKYTDTHFSCPSNQLKGVGSYGNSMATASTNSLRLNNSTDMNGHDTSDWDLDKIDESDQQENFLERAIAEAIKKKGLSAPSFDYGRIN
ncbi:uncharacterized protein LOC143180320 isoform X2 [Calliopsis andreniformis]|uniref:uncharacterized protein LOC143180320 isoform X2 n=1 Tax=Calliopsis andreniformis TaxID=337506 RepID=UPI003FCD12D6